MDECQHAMAELRNISWEIESKKIWLKQPKAASALDFSYFQRVSKLVTHDILSGCN